MGTPTLICVRSCPNLVLQLVGHLDNVARIKDQVLAGRCRIARRGTGLYRLVEVEGRGLGKGNDVSVDDLNGGAPDFLTIIAQQLQNLLPTILAHVGNQGNVGNQNGNVVNENVQENVRNVLMNSNRVGFSYKEFLACNPKEYDGKRGSIVLTRWIEKMEFVQDMSGCSVDQKVKYTAGLRDDKKPSCHERMIRRVRKD
ncbi:hypothetical protein Tco_0200793 [Tanacetum coccineum]